jgi:alpha-1,2-mannosyltransferase
MLSGINPGGWLTAKRLRAHATILAVCLWSLYGWYLATPGLRDRNGKLKGTDFLHLYTLGSLAVAHRGDDLYDMRAQAALAKQRVPEAAGIRYLPLYPPQVSIFFAPLARLSYGWALLAWWTFSAAVYGLCCHGVWRACPQLRDNPGTVLLIAVAFPAFFHLIAWGQTSALALACFTMMFFLLRSRHEFAAGLVLGCLIFKPQLGLAAAVVFMAIGAWRIVCGAVLAAAAELAVGILYYGVEPLRRWLYMLRHVDAVSAWLEPKPFQTHSLRTFWTMLVPGPYLAIVLYGVSALVVLGLTVAVWKRGESVPLALRYSLLLFATVLVAPHLTVYDLVILAPAFLLLGGWIVARPRRALAGWLGTLLYMVYVLPLLGFVARWTHVQLSVIAMAASVYVIWRVCHENERTTDSPYKA